MGRGRPYMRYAAGATRVSQTLLEGVKDGERLKLAAAGAWTAENARALEPAIDAETRRSDTIKRVDIDMARVERLDTFGAWLLERLVRNFSAARLRHQGDRPQGRLPRADGRGARRQAGRGGGGPRRQSLHPCARLDRH